MEGDADLGCSGTFDSWTYSGPSSKSFPEKKNNFTMY